MDRKILVVSTGGDEAYAMLKGIRGSGVFAVSTKAEEPEIPEEVRGAVIIGGENPQTAAFLQGWLQRGLPLLAFGAPTLDLCRAFGGQVGETVLSETVKKVEYAPLGVCCGVEGGMRMLNSAQSLSLPEGIRTLANTGDTVLGFDNGNGISGFQFVPDSNDVEAGEIIGNFLWKTCGLTADFSVEKYMEEAIASIREKVGDGKALCLLSGGVDTVAAACLAKAAVGEKLHCIIIDKGLERSGEVDAIQEDFSHLGLSIKRIDARQKMMEAMASCATTQQKRQAVRALVRATLEAEAESLGDDVTMIFGTNYMDVLEGVKYSESTTRPFVEPLRPLLKREVRFIAGEMGVPEKVITRQHYPAAGIALRCLGYVDADKLDALKRADRIWRETLKNENQFQTGSRVFAVLHDLTGVLEGRKKAYAIVLRAVTERGYNQRLPQDLITRAAEAITANDDRICRVTFDVTPTPPFSVEWE